VANEEKKQKPGKAPGAFRKPIKKEKFEKRFAKYIEHPQDKKFFIGCFKKYDEENVIVRDNLTKEDAKKLKGLLKVIKANRKGAVNLIPLIFASGIVAAIVIFFMIFANPLLGRALEKGLEAIFEAKSDVHNFRLSLIRFQISTKSIIVADRDKPMTNLFQMGGVMIKLKPAAVLRGKIYIEEISADDILFGTPRTVSGALPGYTLRKDRVKPEKEEKESVPLIDLKNFDATALLNQEFDKLTTPKLYDQAIKTYDETSAKWQAQVETSKATVAQLRTSTASLTGLDTSNMRDPDTIRRTITEISTAVSTVQKAADEATTIVSGIEKDVTMVRQMEQNARNAVNDDLNHLKSYIDLGSGSAYAVIEPVIRDILTDTGEQYFDYGLRALEALEKLKATSASKPKEEKPKKVKKIAFKGRDVAFPVVSYPKFYLGELRSNFPIDSWKWAFNLQNVSSDPEWSYNRFKKPVTLVLNVDEDSGNLQRSFAFNGRADFRDAPEERFGADFNATGIPVSLGGQLGSIGVDGLSGNSEITFNMTGRPDGGFSGKGGVVLTGAQLINPRGTIAEATATAISQAPNIELGLEYIHNIGSSDDFNITTNIIDIIGRALRQLAETYARQAIADLERALRQKIDSYIDGRFSSKEQLDSLLAAARGEKAAIDQVKAQLTAKQNELQQKLTGAAQQQAQQAIQNAVPGGLPTPSIPGLPGRR
jgi:uncharacterized protein (TIGR03545 family)